MAVDEKVLSVAAVLEIAIAEVQLASVRSSLRVHSTRASQRAPVNAGPKSAGSAAKQVATARTAGGLTRYEPDVYLLTYERQHAKLHTVVALSFTFVVLTKLVSVPMRLAGAIISIVPVAGNVANDAIGKAANLVDDVPI
ncbi:MAG: hypothetical protein E6J71_08855 [Deltaproteobacteria bacterium]|nr:MAG: hypothetical protein E6J71_08855 [Deltaproteobacteria bacterium]